MTYRQHLLNRTTETSLSTASPVDHRPVEKRRPAPEHAASNKRKRLEQESGESQATTQTVQVNRHIQFEVSDDWE